MRDERLPSENEGPNEPPIPVPPVDESWSRMRKALDLGMPVTKAFYVRPRVWLTRLLRPRFLGAFVLGTALTVILLRTNVHRTHTRVATGVSEPAAVRSPDEATSSSPIGSASTSPIAPASSSPIAPASASPIAPPSASPIAPASSSPIAPASASPTTPFSRSPASPNSAGAPLTVRSAKAVTSPSNRNPPNRHTHNEEKNRTETIHQKNYSRGPQGRAVAPDKHRVAAPDKYHITTGKPTPEKPAPAVSSRRPNYPVAPANLKPRPTFIRYALADSALRRRPPKPNNSASRTAPARTLSFGLTLADRFNLGGQQPAPFTINGKQGTWSDYLPSAHLRAYSGDRWDVQVDLGLFQPQNTRSQLIDSTGGDSSSIPPFQGYRQYNVYVLKKLFYSDLTVSLHHRVFHILWLGAGIEYGRLQGAVGDRQLLMAATNLYVRDTVLQSNVVSIKTNDTAYRRLSRSDWRVLVDLEYRLGRATIGFRYERALNSYLPVQADGSKGSQKNQSLSLRGSFELWRRR